MLMERLILLRELCQERKYNFLQLKKSEILERDEFQKPSFNLIIEGTPNANISPGVAGAVCSI